MNKRRSVQLSRRLSLVTALVVFVVVAILGDAVNVYDGATWWSTPYMMYVLLVSGYAAIACGLMGYGFGRWVIFPSTAHVDDEDARDRM